MNKLPLIFLIILPFLFILYTGEDTYSWDDKTHLVIAKASGYFRWYNIAAADLAKIKAGNLETYNHYSNNPPGRIITAEKVAYLANISMELGYQI